MPVKCSKCGHETVVEVNYCPSCGEPMSAPQEPAPEPSLPPSTEPGKPEQPEVQEQPSADGQAASEEPAASPIVTTPPTVTVAPSAQPPQAAPPVQPPAPTFTPPAATPPAAPAPQPPKKRSSGWLWACGGCGCLLVVIGLAVGIYFVARAAKQTTTKTGGTTDSGGLEIAVPDEGDTGGDTGGETGEDSGGGETVGRRYAGEDFVVVIPPGWEEDAEAEEGVFRLLGPTVEGERLQLAVSVKDLDPGTTLEDFSGGFLDSLKEYDDVSFAEDTSEASLCGEPARRVLIHSESYDFLTYYSVYKDEGFIVAMISPKDTMGEQESAFDEVLDTFQMYE